MKPTNIELGKLIQECRLKKGLTQTELALALGYDSPQFVSSIERGLSNVPYNILGKLIKLIGLPEKRILNTLIAEFEESLVSKIKDGKKSVN